MHNRLRSLQHFAAALLLASSLILLPSAPASAEPVKVRLALAWLAQAQFAGFYMAEEMGYYADAGLDVEIIHGGTDLRPLPALEGGQANFSVMMLERD